MPRRDRTRTIAITRRQCLAACATLAASRFAIGGTSSRSDDLRRATALDLAAGLRAGRWSAREVVDHYLRRIDAINGELGRFDANGALNAFIRVYAQQAIEAAVSADRLRHSTDWSGIPVALKDVFSVANLPVSVGTPAFQSYRAPRDCMLWKIWKEQGAVLVGHTQAQRFISGLTTPQTANPWNPRLIAGGSSGGSAAAVAAGLVPVALGTESAGSLIFPAACCAVTTLKPSHGLLSLEGVYPGLSSFDVAGPMARSAADCAWTVATLAGAERLQWPDYRAHEAPDRRALRGLRFLVSTNERYTDPADRSQTPVHVDARIRRCFERFLTSLEDLGATVIAAEIPETLGPSSRFVSAKDERLGQRPPRTFLAMTDFVRNSIPTQYQWLANASKAERDIAVHWYGGSSERLESDQMLALVALATPETLGICTAARDELRADWERLFDQHRCDAHIYLEIGSPLSLRKGLEDTPEPRVSRRGVEPNDLGWPVLSLPVASDGLEVPVSVQLLARPWHDARLLSWGMTWQRSHPEVVRRLPPQPAPRATP